MANILHDAIKAAAPKLAQAFVSYIEQHKPEIDSRLTAGGTTAIKFVEGAILAALPTTGVAATVFRPEMQAIINNLAADAIKSVGGEVNALIALAELEVTALATKLAGD